MSAKNRAFERLTEDCPNTGLREYCSYIGRILGACEGMGCDEAFEAWLTDAEQCIICEEYFLIEEMSKVTDITDGNTVCICDGCMAGGD